MLFLKTIVNLAISPPYLAPKLVLLMPLAATPVALAEDLTIAVAIPSYTSIIAGPSGGAFCGLRIWA